MASSPAYAALAGGLQPLGLVLCGGFRPLAADAVPPLGTGQVAANLILVGSAGPALWARVRASPEAGAPDPIDRYTRRVIDDLAPRFGCEALYPFAGPPWHPFQRWAMRADPRLERSPLGILIHPEHGLWLAYRAALLSAEPILLPEPPTAGAACSACAGRPCLRTCPAGAVQPRGYDVAACQAYLGSHPAAGCREGCLARRICPVGAARAHGPEQAAHHMRHLTR